MKKISKILSIVLAILMVVCALPISVSAQNVTLTIESSKNDIKAGDIVTVNVILSENSNLSYFTLNIVYDNSKLEYVPAQNGDEEESDPNPLVINPAYAVNKIRVATASTNPITAGGTILSVDFKALSSSCSTVSLEVIESGDKDLKNIPISTSPIKIHSFGDWTTVTEPTCETAGKNKKTCTCGEEITETVDALGHDYSTEFTVDEEAACKETGSKSQHCSRCESKQNVTEIPAKGHSEVTLSEVAPTCTETGLTSGTKCSTCGDVLVAQEEISATGHSVNDDGYCEICEEKVCDHNCHKSGISGFFWKIANFFNKLFGSKKYCDCGVAHY